MSFEPNDLDEQLLDIAVRLAQTVLELVEAGEEGGSSMAAERELLDEWETIYKAVEDRE